MDTVLVTGGLGVVGSAVVPRLAGAGWHATVLDIAANPASASYGDIRKPAHLEATVKEVAGIIHMAAVSRVGWGEDDPIKCWSVNVDGTRNVVEAALSGPRQPWLLFISSREIYGNPSRLPVVEDDPPAPVNTYGRSKAEGERIIATASAAGLRAASIRLPSVYGSASDIPDRVIPAFAARALRGQPLRITDAQQLCDFLHIDDAVDGLVRAALQLSRGERSLPTVHLASGRGTSLGELASLVRELARSSSEIVEEAARPFDVRGFIGDPARARAVLNWTPTVALRDGIGRLLAEMRANRV